jgi:type VI secretion system protein ImpH
MIEKLPTLARNFDFYHAVRLIQSENPHLPRIGNSALVRDDPVRFRQRPFMTFVPSSIDSYEPGKMGKADRMYVFFAGLFGPQGPLPLWLTEYARERERRYDDRTLTDFLNIFHHRFVALFWKAWASSQKTVDIDRDTDGKFSTYFASVIGLGLPSLRNRDSLSDDAKLFFSGRLAPEMHNAEGLAAILQDYFGITATVNSFVGHWLRLPDDAVCRLGESKETGVLGLTAFAGTRVWDTQLRIEIELGAMGLEDFLRLLPSGESFTRLCDWVLNYAGFEYLWRVRLILDKTEVPSARLGQFGQLGWSTWLKSKPFAGNAEVVFNPPERHEW